MANALQDKVAIVTGSGRGVGRAYAHALAAEGAKVVVNDLQSSATGASGAEAVVEEIRSAGGQAAVSHASVADFADAETIIATALESFGRIDIVVANAGIGRPTLLHEAASGDWENLFAVHANGTFNVYRHAVPHMIEGGGGTVITTGDLSQDLMFPREAAYRAAKAAIAVFTLYASEELRPYNINVNSVMPGATDTAMMREYLESLGEDRETFIAHVTERYKDENTVGARPAAPESVPPLGVFLCTDAARGITGRLFTLKHSTIRLFTPNGDVSTIQLPDHERWTTDALTSAVPGWLDGLNTQVV
jgi:NAD(P)-dependent dehydrogenase (short-subunit alcohol dehydrogenase family)